MCVGAAGPRTPNPMCAANESGIDGSFPPHHPGFRKEDCVVRLIEEEAKSSQGEPSQRWRRHGGLGYESRISAESLGCQVVEGYRKSLWLEGSSGVRNCVGFLGQK